MTGFVAIRLRPSHTWRMRKALAIMLLAAAAFLPLHADAYEPRFDAGSTLVLAQGNCMSWSQAIESVRRRTGGQVLSAETRVQGGREVHHIKVLKDGKVRTHKVNGCRR